MELFEETEFLPMFRALIASRGKGAKSRLAKAIGVEPSYISRILKEVASPSLEQAICMTQFFGFNRQEADYFYLLVQKYKVTNAIALDFLDKRLASLRKRAMQVRSHWETSEKIPEVWHALYYSHWLPSAIHMATMVSELRSADAIAKRLGIREKEVKKTLGQLVAMGLLSEANGKFSSKEVQLQLSEDSPFVNRHHANWRLKALEKLQASEAGFYFSGPLCISKAAAVEIRNELLTTLRKVNRKVQQSPSEELYCLNLDLFEL